jgi:hypothetical protein
MAMSPPGTQPRISKMPRTETTLEVVADAPDEKGSWPIEATVVDVTLADPDPAQSNPGAAKALAGSRELVAQVRGAKLKTTVDARGSHSAFTVEATTRRPELAQTFEQLKQSMENFVTPLPEGELGVGARWVVIDRLTTATDIIQIRDVTLKARDGARIEIDVRIEQIAASDKLAGAGPAGGKTPDVSSLESSGKAAFKLDLERLGPEEGQSDVATVMFLTSGRDGLRTETVARASVKSR